MEKDFINVSLTEEELDLIINLLDLHSFCCDDFSSRFLAFCLSRKLRELIKKISSLSITMRGGGDFFFEKIQPFIIDNAVC